MSAANYAISRHFDKHPNHKSPHNSPACGNAQNKSVFLQKTIVAYFLFCAIGIFLGGYATFKAGMSNLTFVYIIVAVLLWLNSSVYRRQMLVGNIIIAIFSAMVPISVLLDIPPIYSFYGQSAFNLNFAVIWIIGIAIFIFVTMFSYEMIKDIEEFESDINYDWKTLPFVMGDRFTKKVIIGVNAAIIAMLFFVCFMFGIFTNTYKYFSFFYIFLFLVIPLLYIIWKIYKASSGDNYRRAGAVMKLVMYVGVAYSVFSFKFFFCV